MDIVPRMGRVQRRQLIRLGRESGDPATSLRFQIVAKLGMKKTSSEVAEALDVARSTVVKTAHHFAEEGIAGLRDKRRLNGRPKVDDSFRRRMAGLLRRTPEDFGWRRPTWTRELLCEDARGRRRGTAGTWPDASQAPMTASMPVALPGGADTAGED